MGSWSMQMASASASDSSYFWMAAERSMLAATLPSIRITFSALLSRR